MLVFKSIGTEIQDIDQKEGVVRMYWNALGNLDSDGDRILRGAYEKTIAERGPEGSNRIKFLWQHDIWEPIGIPTELTEDPGGPGPEGGLLATVKVAGTQRGKDALILYEEGVITEHSVGIDILRRDEEDRSNILEVRLWEGSAVTWGANPLTPTLEVKSDDPRSNFGRVVEHSKKMRRALRSGLSDETADQLELGLATLEGQLLELSKSIPSAPTDSAPPEGTREGTPHLDWNWMNEQLDTFHSYLTKQ